MFRCSPTRMYVSHISFCCFSPFPIPPPSVIVKVNILRYQGEISILYALRRGSEGDEKKFVSAIFSRVGDDEGEWLGWVGG